MNVRRVILETKLRPPRLGRQTIARRRLEERFARSSRGRLTLVSAPPGYGKTTAVCRGLTTLDRAYAWLTLDIHDNTLAGFVEYLIAAVRLAAPEACATTAAYLESSPPADPVRLADIMLRDLGQSPALAQGPLVMVLDDYHVITEIEIHAFMTRLIAHQDDRLRLVLITRADPPLPLARLRLDGQLAEIRAWDLRLTMDEVRQLLQQDHAIPLEPTLAADLQRYTEGWPAGLQMALFALQNQSDPARFVAGLAAHPDRVISDYLLEEMLARQDAPLRRLLLRLSIFDRISLPLIEMVMPDGIVVSPGESILDRLWRANFFLTALDAEGVWFRFHHLVRSFLAQRLIQSERPATIQAFHQQACLWFMAEGLNQEAIDHMQRHGDVTFLFSIAEPAMLEAINENNWRTLDLWLRALPDTGRDRPVALLVQAEMQRYLNNVQAIPPLVQAAAAGLHTHDYGYSHSELAALQGLSDTLSATAAAHAHRHEEAVRYADRALSILPAGQISARSLAEYTRLSELLHLGLDTTTVQETRAEIRREIARPTMRLVRLLLAFCGNDYARADVWSLEKTIEQVAFAAQRLDHPVFKAWAAWGRGWIHYQRNQLAAASDQFRQVIAARNHIHSGAYTESVTGLALIYRNSGDLQAARRTVIDMHTFAQEHGLLDLRSTAESLSARIAAPINGRREASGINAPATHRQNGAAAVSRFGIASWEWPPLTVIRRHLEHGTAADLAAAGALMAQCQALLARGVYTRRIIELNVLKARLAHDQGNTEATLNALRTAVALAAPGGALRLIVDDADPLTDLLADPRVRLTAPAFVDEVLAILTSGGQPPPSPPSNPSSPQIRSAPMSEDAAERFHLSAREVVVLGLLTRGLTNKAIAGRLSLSPSTIRKCTISIYAKLQVANRTEAADKARQFDLVPPPD